MGYTHNWTNIKSTDEDWDNFVNDVRHVLALSRVPLEVEILEDTIDINGVGDDAHENLVIGKDYRDSSFCKTARKPYDAVVCAVLHLYEEHCGKEVHVSSDGDLTDEGWQIGYQFILKEFGVEYLTGCYYRRRSEARKESGDKDFRLPEMEQKEFGGMFNDTVPLLEISDEDAEDMFQAIKDIPEGVTNMDNDLPPLGDNDSWCGPDEVKVSETAYLGDKFNKNEVIEKFDSQDEETQFSEYDLLKMELHEVRSISGYEILRVLGGWIYYSEDRDYKKDTSTFVPERQ